MCASSAPETPLLTSALQRHAGPGAPATHTGHSLQPRPRHKDRRATCKVSGCRKAKTAVEYSEANRKNLLTQIHLQDTLVHANNTVQNKMCCLQMPLVKILTGNHPAHFLSPAHTRPGSLLGTPGNGNMGLSLGSKGEAQGACSPHLQCLHFSRGRGHHDLLVE